MQKRVLIVEDEPGIRLLLNEILKKEGHEVMQATTGKEALEKIATSSFDLLIIDYKLPVLDGIEVIKQLQTDQHFIPCIMMTGLIELVAEQLEKIDFVKGVIAKPFNVDELCEIVQKIFPTVQTKQI